MNEYIIIISHLVVWGIGIATGMYIASQTEKHVDKNIKNEK